MIVNPVQFIPKFNNRVKTQSEFLGVGNLDFVRLGRRKSLHEIQKIFSHIENQNRLVSHVIMNEGLSQDFCSVMGEGRHKLGYVEHKNSLMFFWNALIMVCNLVPDGWFVCLAGPNPSDKL